MLVLGAGWVGSRLVQVLLEQGRSVVATHRPGTVAQEKPPYFRPVEVSVPAEGASESAPSGPRFSSARFELDDRETWSNLPPASSVAAVVITFPLATAPEEFWEAYLRDVRSVLCYSSTSVYQVDAPGQRVDESTPTKPAGRAAAEAYALSRGATVLTISGIFGERRSPRGICTCLSTYTSAGGALNGNKRVNMVHVDDIIAASLACLRAPRASSATRINVAGHHFLLSELIEHCKHPPIPDGPDTDLSSKCVCSQRLRKLMPRDFDFIQPMAPDTPAEPPFTASASAPRA